MANLLCVGVSDEEKESTTESIMSAKLVNALLASQELWRRLPQIRFYARRPIFDENFNLCGPGWQAEKGILIHGPEIEPSVSEICSDPAATANDRLPPFLRRLLREFCFLADADLVNTLAMFLTGLLINHFVEDPHPGFILDGNQPLLGKTLLIQVLGRILDGVEPPRTPLVQDEELEKKLCAQLRKNKSRIFFFDNQRRHVESALLEANMLSPLLEMRILGQNATISRPNIYLWVVTANFTSGTGDFLSRNALTRFFYEGDPKKRKFETQPLDFAIKHRVEILAELAGMVLMWKQAGMPLSTKQHRCGKWAAVIGGILEVAGFDQFLANHDEAEVAMDPSLLALSELAEWVVNKNKLDFFTMTGVDSCAKGQPAKQWVQLFIEAKVYEDKLSDRKGKGQEAVVGQFLSGKVDRTVEITTTSGSGTATLRTRSGPNRKKIYWFEIAIISPGDGSPHPIGSSSAGMAFAGVAPTPPWATGAAAGRAVDQGQPSGKAALNDAGFTGENAQPGGVASPTDAEGVEAQPVGDVAGQDDVGVPVQHGDGVGGSGAPGVDVQPVCGDAAPGDPSGAADGKAQPVVGLPAAVDVDAGVKGNDLEW